jgi:hypothetical protein
MVFLSFSAALVMIGCLVVYIDRYSHRRTGSLSWSVGAGIVIAVGLISLVGARLVRRPLDCSTDVTLAASYGARFFAQAAFAESTVLLGFVTFFLTGNSGMYALGLAFTAVGFVRLAPTAGNLERAQQELGAEGCGRSLVAALRHPEEPR